MGQGFREFTNLGHELGGRQKDDSPWTASGRMGSLRQERCFESMEVGTLPFLFLLRFFLGL